jgi:hypothetical protein
MQNSFLSSSPCAFTAAVKSDGADKKLSSKPYRSRRPSSCAAIDSEIPWPRAATATRRARRTARHPPITPTTLPTVHKGVSIADSLASSPPPPPVIHHPPTSPLAHSICVRLPPLSRLLYRSVINFACLLSGPTRLKKKTVGLSTRQYNYQPCYNHSIHSAYAQQPPETTVVQLTAPSS